MLYIQKIDDYLKILIAEQVKDFVAVKFSEYYIPISKEKNLGKAANLMK